MVFVIVAKTDELKDGDARVVEANGREIALYRIDGEFFATTNKCPHKGGPLGNGIVNDNVVICPWHAWQFDIKTGISPVNRAFRIDTYAVKIEDDNVLVDID